MDCTQCSKKPFGRAVSDVSAAAITATAAPYNSKVTGAGAATAKINVRGWLWLQYCSIGYCGVLEKFRWFEGTISTALIYELEY
jgi:hypothetical protein